MMYVVTQTRADIAYAVTTLACFLQNPSPQHVKAAEWCMRYLKGTIYHGIAYGGKEAEFDDMRLNCYTDSDYAKDRI